MTEEQQEENPFLKEKTYIKNVYNPKQEKKANKLTKAVAKTFNPAEITNIEIFGEDINAILESIKIKQEGLSEKELKKNQKLYEWYDTNYGDYYTAFHLNSPLKKLLWKEERLESKEILYRTMWTGILDFPVEHPFIFGRVHKHVRHKGGTYLFASIADDLPSFLELIRDFQKENPDLNHTDIIEHVPFMEVLSKISYLEPMRNVMKYALHLNDNKLPTNIELIDNMNQNRKLVRKMKDCPTYGTIEKATGYGKAFMQSDVDISTICFPYENNSIIQLVEISHLIDNKKALAPMKSLIDYLTH